MLMIFVIGNSLLYSVVDRLVFMVHVAMTDKYNGKQSAIYCW